MRLPFSGEQLKECLIKARDFSSEPLGDGLYKSGKEYKTYQQYLNDNGGLYRVNPSVALPYLVNTTRYGSAKDDPNLIPYVNFESASTEAIAEMHDKCDSLFDEFKDSFNAMLDSFKIKLDDAHDKIDKALDGVEAEAIKIAKDEIKVISDMYDPLAKSVDEMLVTVNKRVDSAILKIELSNKEQSKAAEKAHKAAIRKIGSESEQVLADAKKSSNIAISEINKEAKAKLKESEVAISEIKKDISKKLSESNNLVEVNNAKGKEIILEIEKAAKVVVSDIEKPKVNNKPFKKETQPEIKTENITRARLTNG